MNKKLLIGLVAGLIVIVAGGWLFAETWQRSSTTDSQKTDTSNSQTNPENTVAAATITYTDNGFTPDKLTVKAGDTIRIVNQSSGTLEFSSNDHPTHLKDPELNMAELEPGKDQMLKVTDPGEWGFHNHLKAEDTGTLTVTQ